MSDLIPGTPSQESQGSILTPLTDPAGGNAMARIRTFAGQGAVKRMLPWFLGVSALGAVALTYSTLAPAPQRTLYTELNDSERGAVVDALDKASIHYKINNETGALTVNEDDLYRARMLVAQNGALAQPQSGDDLLDKLPMGASRELEGERLRSAREHDLQLTIQQIDGVEAVRVHLAEAEKSVFVRDNLPPTASVMVRLARGRQLSQSQVTAIVNLVAGSIPGLTPDAVRVVDQQGRLISDKTGNADSDRLELQSRMEDKLRAQVSQLLTPMLGDGNFSSEIQVDLDMDQVTSARETYDKPGVVRSETQQQSQTTAAQPAAGVPGVLSNTPPPPTTAQAGPPTGTPTPAASGAAPTTSDTSSTRNYELGREVAVANTTPGKIKRISVAVALSAKAMKSGKATDIDQIKQLVSAAVGADTARGDQVAVITRSFEPIDDAKMPFYEAPWFATVVRNAVALIAVLMVLLLGVRPLIKVLRGKDAAPKPEDLAEITAAEEEPIELIPAPLAAEEMMDPDTGTVDAELLSQQVGLAQRIASERPEDAVVALRQMLNPPAQPEAA